MPPRSELSVTLLSTWVIFFGFLLLGGLLSPVAWVFTWLWTLLLVSDLHVALPESFFETEQEALRYLVASFLFSVASLVIVRAASLTAWLGLDLVQPHPLAWLLVSVPGIAVHVLLVRHVLSGIETLASGRPSRAGWVETVVNALFPPLFVLSSHYYARKHLVG